MTTKEFTEAARMVKCNIAQGNWRQADSMLSDMYFKGFPLSLTKKYVALTKMLDKAYDAFRSGLSVYESCKAAFTS